MLFVEVWEKSIMRDCCYILCYNIRLIANVFEARASSGQSTMCHPSPSSLMCCGGEVGRDGGILIFDMLVSWAPAHEGFLVLVFSFT